MPELKRIAKELSTTRTAPSSPRRQSIGKNYCRPISRVKLSIWRVTGSASSSIAGAICKSKLSSLVASGSPSLKISRVSPRKISARGPGVTS